MTAPGVGMGSVTAIEAPSVAVAALEPDGELTGLASMSASGSAVRTTERTIERLAVIMAAGWLVSLVVASFGPLSTVPHWVAVLCLAANGTATALFALDRRFRRVLLWTLTASALAVIATAGPLLTFATAPLAMYWINLSSVLNGTLRVGRRGAALVLMLAVALVSAFVWQQAELTGQPEQVLQLAAALLTIACVDGLSAWTAAGAVRTMAARTDAAAVELEQAMAAAAATEGAELETHRIRRFLHDNVVNTLAAARTASDLSPDLLRERCRWDLEQLARVDLSPAPSLCELADRAQQRALLCGVDLQTECTDEALSTDVAAALESALAEGLNNVAKHTARRRAWLTAEPGRLVLQDVGPGVTRQDLGPGGSRSLIHGCERAGLTVEVEAIAGRGTRITYSWPAAGPRPEEEEPDQSLSQVLAQGSMRITMLMSLVFVANIVTGLTLQFGIPDLLAMLGMLALIAWGYAASRGKGPVHLPWPVAFAGTLLITTLPGLGLAGCARVGPWWDGPLAGLAAALAFVLIDGRRVAIVASLSGYLLGDLLAIMDAARTDAACAFDNTALLLLDFGVVVAIILFRGAIERNWREMVTQRAHARQIRLATAQAHAAQQVRRDHSQRTLAVARGLLEGLASGALDPRDESVRQQCATTELVLRSLIAVPPQAGPLGQGLAELVVESAATGPVLQVHAVVDTAPGPQTTREALAALRSAVLRWRPGQPATVSVIGHADRLRILGSGTTATEELPQHPQMEQVGDAELLTATWDSPND